MKTEQKRFLGFYWTKEDGPEKRYTYSRMEVAGQPTLYILRDGERFMGSIHCSSPAIEDIVDSLNALSAERDTLKQQRDEAVEVLEAIMEHYNAKGQLLSFNVNIVRQALLKLKTHNHE